MSKQRESYFYKQLVPFLIGAYPNIQVQKAELLGKCALGYFNVLLTIDRLIDQKEKLNEDVAQLFGAIQLHEQVIRQLCELIGNQSSTGGLTFWSNFEVLKKKYVQTILFEKQISVAQKHLSEQNFEELAYGKSAICCAIVHGLQALCKEDAELSKIETILKHIHIAFQYLDDISDFKKDIEENQWTYPQVLLNDYLERNALEVHDINIRHKYLFLSGIAQKMVQKSVFHYEKAADLAQNIGLFDLQNYLLKERANALFYQNEINYLIEKTQLKSKKSQIFQTNNSLKDTIKNGLKYLTNNAKEGFWTDFMTSAGRGKTWISSYIGVQLAEHNLVPELLKTVLSDLSKTGSYNDSVMQDADSTTFLIGLHQAINGNIPGSLIDSWLKFQLPDGSWATYHNEAELRQALDLETDISVQGWLSGHGCVSAAAALVLSNIPNLSNQYDKTINQLVDLVQNNSLNAYWWTSDVYVQVFTLLAFCKTDCVPPTIKTKLLESIIALQNPDGFWRNPSDGEASPFYTALGLKAMVAYQAKNHRIKIENTIRWLQNHQTTDGSWKTSRILRIPATDVLHPTLVKHWRNSSFGVNALSDDHNRVFTTSTVVNALADYQKFIQQ
ncbi:hypothetical protein [Runella salmonicolor]|uniref:Squalene cyclase C-terminal domain-containing protein n=1 Tax=Runella salmonicolor TaxID=2950278 RepID=A0ABT1FT51_9BACT|nr:hypothetical protein [Runella salmonicolor]MCP1384929.1 hypothetical protein [Runella salmonicolor]